MAVFSIFANFGLTTITTREVAKDTSLASKYAANLIPMELLLALAHHRSDRGARKCPWVLAADYLRCLYPAIGIIVNAAFGASFGYIPSVRTA